MERKTMKVFSGVFFAVCLILPPVRSFAAGTTVLSGLELKDERFRQTVTAPGYFKLVFQQNAKILTNPGESRALGAKITEAYDLENDPKAEVNYCSVNYDIAGSSLGYRTGPRRRLKTLK